MAAPLYTTDILRLATSIPNMGRLAAPQGSDERRSPVCGSRIIVDVQLDAEGHVTAFAQDVKACALGQASANLLGSHIIGKTADDLTQVSESLALWLGSEGRDAPDWPGLSLFEPARAHPGRHAAIRLPFEAAAAAARKARG